MSDPKEILAARTIRKLTQRRMTLATAESCTGGLLSHTLTNIPGASAVYIGGIIAYANQVKTSLLGVPVTLIQRYGAVSTSTVRAMAEGVRSAMKTDLAIATTGIAGPSGGSKEKPVGLVYIAFSSAHETSIKKIIFKGSRHQIKQQTTAAALNMLLDFLQKNRNH